MATLTVANIVKRLQNVFPGLPGRALYELFTTTRTDLVAVEARATALETYAPINCTAATLTVTAATHANRVITLNRAGGIAVDLPAATGTGARYTFIVGTTFTSAGTISVVGNDTMVGLALGLDGDGVPANAWAIGGAQDRINMDGSTQGGVKGDSYILTDIGADLWHAQVFIQQSGTEATPMSESVT